MKHIASFSAGKDSTAMVLRLIEEKFPLDDIVYFEADWEFPQMANHVLKVQEHIGREITILHPPETFEYWMINRKIVGRAGKNKGKFYRTGYGWPSPIRRWCTALKRDVINKHCRQKYGKGYSVYIGFAADEVKRTGCGNACAGEEKNGRHQLYPLIFDWDMDEKDCLQYCYDRGFDWGGLYKLFRRVSCFCCPLQRLGELKTLRREFPDLWSKMLEWDKCMSGHNRGFYGYATVHDLDRRFAQEPSFHNYMAQMEQREMMGK